jgi:hypothetical protein
LNLITLRKLAKINWVITNPHWVWSINKFYTDWISIYDDDWDYRALLTIKNSSKI